MNLTPLSSIRCPVCSGRLRPAVLVCPECDIRIEGNFRQNEFASLGEEDLHLLRIFVHCDGRIRDMEAALGVSYPTIKTRMAALKDKLLSAGGNAGPSEPGIPTPEDEPSIADGESAISPSEVLEQLESGKISFEQAKALLAGEES